MPARVRPMLLYGYGNPSRGDDGLGPALVAALEAYGLADLDLDANFQLSLEDAQAITGYRTVIFADAAAQGPGPFTFERITASEDAAIGWTSHSVKPQQVVTLASRLFHCEVDAYALAIRGHVFGDFCEELSKEAQANLSQALAFVRELATRRDPIVSPLAYPLAVPPAIEATNRKAQP
jgi:hydrogenase maturation protease